jgi:hypothetical protein
VRQAEKVRGRYNATVHYKLYYDASCPVCSFLADALKKKAGLHNLGIFPLTDNEKRLKLETPAGKTLFGQNAIRELTNVFPEILDYFRMLPEPIIKDEPRFISSYKLRNTFRAASRRRFTSFSNPSVPGS